MSSTDTGAAFLSGTIARLRATKALGDGVLGQVSDAELFLLSDAEANSIAIIVRHLHGNMLSRWTDFLTTDGDKPTRQRDREFEQPATDRNEVLRLWEEGWACTFQALEPLTPSDVLREVRIRGEPLTVLDAILRQLAHYSYHVGQMVTLARQQLGSRWQTLSIARGKSQDYRPVERASGTKE
ncbi:MAG: DUF1572 family protein [Planctomycetes bacterium]|nr:DUF1572 family protein [Planctomycetota bacterium]